MFDTGHCKGDGEGGLVRSGKANYLLALVLVPPGAEEPRLEVGPLLARRVRVVGVRLGKLRFDSLGYARQPALGSHSRLGEPLHRSLPRLGSELGLAVLGPRGGPPRRARIGLRGPLGRRLEAAGPQGGVQDRPRAPAGALLQGLAHAQPRAAGDVRREGVGLRVRGDSHMQGLELVKVVRLGCLLALARFKARREAQAVFGALRQCAYPQPHRVGAPT
mmetsp:Transcript_44024/g.127320  ORF Transcript_44024/g.127320 Transcript_44024/m.127320 type:complete len:219 (-) Transcript_44024:375-1031(-)